MNSIRRFRAIAADAIAHEGGLVRLVVKFVAVVAREGFVGIGVRFRHLVIVAAQRRQKAASDEVPYDAWICDNDDLNADGARKVIEAFDNRPLVSIVCPVFNPDIGHLAAAIDSVLGQVYEAWELCIVDDASTDPRVPEVLARYGDERIRSRRHDTNQNVSMATNTGIEMATGDYITFLDQDDELSPLALFWVAHSLDRCPSAQLVYSDEDKLDEEGRRCDPHFKPDWNYQLLLSRNYLCHLVVYSRALVDAVGGCRAGLEGAQDYDLALRAIETLAPEDILHVPRVLYHWRKHEGSTAQSELSKPFALEAGLVALEQHLRRTNPGAAVSTEFTRYEVEFPTPDPAPPVTIIICTRNQPGLLRQCVESIQGRTDYVDWQVMIVDNDSDEPETRQLLQVLDERDGISVISDRREFNFSALNNSAVAAAPTEVVCLLNDDIEVIDRGWLREMVSLVALEDVGVIGAKLLYPDATVQHGGIVLGIGGVAGHAHKGFPADHPGYADRLCSRHELSAVTAACMLTTRSLFEAVGGLDEEQLAVSFNDVDFCLKVRKAGKKVVWTPHARLYHHESKSRGSDDTLAKLARAEREAETMSGRWGESLQFDPHYNPNLSLETHGFELAATSRNLRVDQLAAEQVAGPRE